MGTRGEHLIRADRGFATGGSLIGWAVAPGFARVLDSLDRRLKTGGIDATLPDGGRRRIGFHAPGFRAEVDLHSWMALVRLATAGSVGWYKAWTKGEWSSPDPVPLFALFMQNAESLRGAARAKGPFRLLNAIAHRFRDNDRAGAKENIQAHYDLGNDFYAAWLDPTMSYSSARFSGANDLAEAQIDKVNSLLGRLNLKAGDRLLEIGCGWGTLAIEAAKRGATVVGLTLSAEQKAWSERRIAQAGLSDRIEIRLQDYRDIDEQFDAVASVEMVEAVGERWWPAFMDCLARNLRPGGLAALQYILIRPELFEAYAKSADFIQTYIFPGGMLIHEPRFERAAKAQGMGWRNRSENFGLDYARTLQIWRNNYDQAVRRGELEGFSDEFHNLWRYYLMYCEGGFRGRGIDVAQVTLVKS